MATLEQIDVSPSTVTVQMQSLGADCGQTITSTSPEVVRFIIQLVDARADYAYRYLPT